MNEYASIGIPTISNLTILECKCNLCHKRDKCREYF